MKRIPTMPRATGPRSLRPMRPRGVVGSPPRPVSLRRDTKTPVVSRAIIADLLPDGMNIEDINVVQETYDMNTKGALASWKEST